MKEDPQKVSSPEQKAADQKILRQVAVTTSKAKWDDLGMAMGQMSETRDALASKGDGPVKDREPEKDPVLLRPILALLTLAAIVSGCIAVFYAVDGRMVWQPWVVLVVCGGLRGLYAYLKYRKEQRAWIDRMNQSK